MWLDNLPLQCKKATKTKYRYLIDRHILQELGDVEIRKITTSMINDFLQQKLKAGRLDKKGGLSSGYVRNIMLIIYASYNFAVQLDLCEPLKAPIQKPSVPKQKVSVLPYSQQKKLDAFLMQDTDETKLGILLSLHMGLRCGEICALRWSDVDLENNILHIRHTVARVQNKEKGDFSTVWILDTPKTESSRRDIPIVSYLRPYLIQGKEKALSEFVVSTKETFLSPRTYEFRYKKVLEKCEISPINYHALRHTFATRCAEAQIDAKTISELLGHASVGITLNTYVHSCMSLKRKQLEKLAELLIEWYR